MRKVVLALLLVYTSFATAQKTVGTVTLYPRLGINLSKFSNGYTYHISTSGMGENTIPKYRCGYEFGFELQRQVYKTVGASAALYYSSVGTEYSDYSTESENVKIVTRNFQCILNYLNLPVTVTFNVIGWRNAVFSVKGGFQLGYLVSSKTKNSIDFFNKEDGLWVLNKEKSGMVSGSNNSIYKKMNVAIPVGVEFEYKRLSLGLQYVIGLTKIYSGMNNNINNRSFVLSMGYGITL